MLNKHLSFVDLLNKEMKKCVGYTQYYQSNNIRKLQSAMLYLMLKFIILNCYSYSG